MNFLTLAWFGQNSVAKFVKTLLFSALWIFPGAVPLAIYGFTQDFENLNTQTLVTGNASGLLLILVMLSSATVLFGIIRQTIIQHDRDWITLITPKQNIDWKKFALAMCLWGGIVLVSIIFEIISNPNTYQFTFQPIPFFSLVGGILLMIPIQASSEELIFRGYILQQSALVGRYVFIPIIISSLLFALMHSANPEVTAYGFSLAMTNYALSGMIWGIATIMDDGLELAMGAHTGNNIIAFLLVTNKNAVLHTPALFTDINPVESWQGVGELTLAGIIFLFILSRIYKWGSWSILWSKIIPPATSDTKPLSQSGILPEQA